MDAGSELSLDNKKYLNVVRHYLWKAYKLDQPRKDITSQLFLDQPNQKIQATIVAKQAGMLAGMEEALWFLDKLGVLVTESEEDGSPLEEGEIILKLQGSAKRILAAERSLLNTLQRMSGIATKTQKMVDKIDPSIQLLATRKTLWGWMDKKAVVIGGGGTHRLDLSDAILIKDNHLNLNHYFEKYFKKCLKKIDKVRFIEIEVDSEIQLKVFLEDYQKLKKKLNLEKRKVVIMLDNFKPAQIKKWIKPLRKEGLLVEASGGIHDKNIGFYNIPGLTAISSSSITMAAPHLDLSLDIQS